MEASRRKIIRYVIIGLFVAASLWLVIALDNVFGPLLLALLVAYILNPVVNWIMKVTKLPRGAAIGVIFILFYASLVGFVALTIPTLIAQVGDLYQAAVGERTYAAEDVRDADLAEGKSNAPSMKYVPKDAAQRRRISVEEQADGRVVFFHDRNWNGTWDPGYVRALMDWLTKLRKRFSDSPDLRHYPLGAERVQQYLAENGEKAVVTTVNVVGQAVYTLVGILTAFVLIPIYLFYFLMGLTSIRDRTFELFPGRFRDRIIGILTRMDEATSAFFKGRLIIMVIKGALAAAALAIVGLPYALFLGVVTGIGSLIPVVGSVIGLLPAVAIALLDSGSPGLAITVAVIFVVIEIFENYALTPWILKDRVGLHPVTILVSVFVAGALFGFVGMLLSVPIASVAKILYTEFVLPEIRALAAEKPPG